MAGATLAQKPCKSYFEAVLIKT